MRCIKYIIYARIYIVGNSKPKSWPHLVQRRLILSVRMWLGCHFFPSPPHSDHCVCGNIIDHFGDHVLGCGHAPLWIKCHDALCDIIWHTLLQDNRGATKDQRCGDNNHRTGDVFYPDFRFGKPAYFDVSGRGSLQPQYLSKAADHPGVAGEAGEIEKDEKHEVNVLAAGGLFFPLFVESLGLWTFSSLKILKFLCPNPSPSMIPPLSLAVSYLHQQLLSVWGYNAQILLSRFLDTSEIIDFPT